MRHTSQRKDFYVLIVNHRAYSVKRCGAHPEQKKCRSRNRKWEKAVKKP